MNNPLPQRKHTRLPRYDYSAPGAYFVTICTQDRRCLLSHVVGRGLAPAAVECTVYGEVARQQLLRLPQRYPFVQVDSYVIMPNHIHILLRFTEETAGASPRPTLTDVVCAYKSLTVRECKRLHPIGQLFQTSFYEHVVRNRQDYDEIAAYIRDNPARWQEDKLYTET